MSGMIGLFGSVGIYIAGYVAWGEFFRSRVDPLMRGVATRILGTAIVARQHGDEAFSIPLWRSVGPSAVERNGFLGFVSAAWLLLGALAPILGLIALCATTSWVSDKSREALYLMSSTFLVVFLIQQTRRKGHAPETRGEASLPSSRNPLRLPREEDS
jgi:hypothetical protein